MSLRLTKGYLVKYIIVQSVDRIEKANFVQAVMADRKNKLYLITERFFNIWYLMRYGKKKGREQVLFLVRFLEEWCGPEELTERIRRHISLAKAKDLHAKGAYYMCEALAQCAPSADLQEELILSTRDYLTKTSPDLAEALAPSDRELIAQAFSLAKKDIESALRKLQEIQRPDAERWNIFGLFYLEVANEPEKAESYFCKALEKGHASAMNNLAWLFFKNIRNRAEALQLAARSVEISKNADNTHSLAVCLLWHDRYNESVEMFFDCLEFDPFDRLESDITFYLIFLLAKKQHHLLLQLFKDERYQLKARFKPVYYALMHRMRTEFPKEYLKMGGELRQTVEEILAEADKMALDYQT